MTNEEAILTAITMGAVFIFAHAFLYHVSKRN